MKEQLESQERSAASPTATENYQATTEFMEKVADKTPLGESRETAKNDLQDGEETLAASCVLADFQPGVDTALYVRQSGLGVSGKLELTDIASHETSTVLFSYHNDSAESGEFPQRKSYLQHEISADTDLPSYPELLNLALEKGSDFSFTMHHLK